MNQIFKSPFAKPLVLAELRAYLFMELISRVDSKAQSLLHYYTGKPCKYGHTALRYVKGGHCYLCSAEKQQTPDAKLKKAVREQTSERKAKIKAYRQTHAAKERKATYDKTPKAKANKASRSKKPEYKAKAATYRKTPEYKAKAALTMATYRATNKERIAAMFAAWAEANAHIMAAKNAQRRAAKIQRTPKWLTPADKSAIKAIYEQCAFTSRVTGQAHHVDHILPLQGEFVSGLHCPANLQILTATENVKKSNKLLDDPFLQ